MQRIITSKAIVFGLLLFAAPSNANPDTADSFAFIFSTEFKDVEVARLLALPPEVVPSMSNSLEQMDAGDQKRHRLISSLIMKLKQDDLNLPLAVRLQAITALKGKFSTVNKAKQDLIRMVESDLSRISTQPSRDKAENDHWDVNSSEGQNATPVEPSHRSPAKDRLIWVWIAGLGAVVLATWVVIKRPS